MLTPLYTLKSPENVKYHLNQSKCFKHFLYFFFIFLQKEAEQAKKESDRTMEIEENGAHEQTAAKKEPKQAKKESDSAMEIEENGAHEQTAA